MPRSELEPLFEMMRGAPLPQSIAEMRSGMVMFAPFINANAPQVGAIHEGVAIADGVRADVIVPPGTRPVPDTHLPARRRLVDRQPGDARQAGARALRAAWTRWWSTSTTGWRPSIRFPCRSTTAWRRRAGCAHNVARYGGHPDRIAIGGDSAGGNLSAAVVNDLRDEMTFRAVLLIYGAFDLLASRRDYDRWAPEEDPVLPKRSMDMMLQAYLSGGASVRDPRVSPIHADSPHFPPACLLCGTWDPLLGDSVAFDERLRAHGRQSTLLRYDGMPHAFLQLPVSEAETALADAARFLREKLRA